MNMRVIEAGRVCAFSQTSSTEKAVGIMLTWLRRDPIVTEDEIASAMRMQDRDVRLADLVLRESERMLKR